MSLSRAVASLFTFVAIVFFSLPAESYQVVDIRNGGAIEGKVVFEGSAPTRKIIPTKDKEVCGGVREEVPIVVGPDKGVHGAVVYLKRVKKGKAWPDSALKTPELNNEKCRFVPNVQVVRRGPIEIVNSDPILHNTHAFYGRRTAFNVALPNQGQRIKQSLRRPGTVRVECDAHHWMLGWIYVVANPYYAITAEDGTFTVTDIPPGDYTLVATHGYTRAIEIPVTVKANEAARVSIELKK